MSTGGTLVLTLEGVGTLEEFPAKPDGTPDVRRKEYFRVRLVRDNKLIVWEETLPREKLPADPEKFLSERIAKILHTHIPGIDPL